MIEASTVLTLERLKKNLAPDEKVVLFRGIPMVIKKSQRFEGMRNMALKVKTMLLEKAREVTNAAG